MDSLYFIFFNTVIVVVILLASLKDAPVDKPRSDLFNIQDPPK